METSALLEARLEKDLTQAQVAEYTGVDVGTVSRWERGIHQPYACHSKKLCELFGKTAQELGLVPSEAEADPSPSVPAVSPKGDTTIAKYIQRDIELRLQYTISDWLYCEKPSGSSSAVLQHRLHRELEDYSMDEQPKQNPKDTDINRRAALHRLALFPIKSWGLDTLNAAPKWAAEDLLPHCAAGITACDYLSKGQREDMNLAYEVLTTYLNPLKDIVDQSSQHRQEAAELVAQALLIKATLSVHRDGPKRATSYGKQAMIYSKESGNIPLRLASLGGLAWMYSCDKQERQALETVLQAQALLQKQQKKGLPIPTSIQSSIFGEAAKYQACNGLDEDALIAIHEAKDAFFASDQPNDDTPAFVDANYSNLILDDGLTYYYLEQHEKALEVFAQAIDPKTLTPKVPIASLRTHVEIINNQTLASLKSPKKHMELSIKLWKAGIQGAIDLRSEQRFGEALTAYAIMQALWPGDKRIKELRDLTRHW